MKGDLSSLGCWGSPNHFCSPGEQGVSSGPSQSAEIALPVPCPSARGSTWKGVTLGTSGEGRLLGALLLRAHRAGGPREPWEARAGPHLLLPPAQHSPELPGLGPFPLLKAPLAESPAPTLCCVMGWFSLKCRESVYTRSGRQRLPGVMTPVTEGDQDHNTAQPAPLSHAPGLWGHWVSVPCVPESQHMT